MGFVGTSDHEIFALMLFPIPRQRCWHVDVEAYCRGTIWQNLVQLEFQCASLGRFHFALFALDHTKFYILILSQHFVWVVSLLDILKTEICFFLNKNYMKYVRKIVERALNFFNFSFNLNDLEKISRLHGTLWFFVFYTFAC